MYQCDVAGNVARRWKLARVNDLALSADGAALAMVCQEKEIKVASARDPREVPPGWAGLGLGWSRVHRHRSRVTDWCRRCRSAVPRGCGSGRGRACCAAAGRAPRRGRRR